MPYDGYRRVTGASRIAVRNFSVMADLAAEHIFSAEIERRNHGNTMDIKTIEGKHLHAMEAFEAAQDLYGNVTTSDL